CRAGPAGRRPVDPPRVLPRLRSRDARRRRAGRGAGAGGGRRPRGPGPPHRQHAARAPAGRPVSGRRPGPGRPIAVRRTAVVTTDRSAGTTAPAARRVTVPEVRAAKGRAEPLTMLTAYDAPTARLLDEAGVEILLVGDSVG